MDVFRLVADRKIAEAMEEGAFDNLSGKGQPLDLSEEPFVDPALRMGHRLLRNNGFAPWRVLERKEILASRDALLGDFTQGRIDLGSLRVLATALNQRILNFNLQAPSTAQLLQLPL